MSLYLNPSDIVRIESQLDKILDFLILELLFFKRTFIILFLKFLKHFKNLKKMKKLLNPKIAKLRKKGKIKNNSKISPIQLVLPILLIIVYLLLKKETKMHSPPPQSEKINSPSPQSEKINSPSPQSEKINSPPPQSENLLKFKDLLPKSKNKNFNSLDDIFKSRELIINDNNISNQYINYIKPFNETEENNYQNKLYENEENFERFLKKRDDQLSYKEFIKMCQNEKLIDFNIPKDNDNPVISIIVSSYNKENLVIKTVRSIQNQSFKNIEIIIVDDCSTDNSYTKYKSLLESDPRIRIFYHQKNMGVWRTRITGFLYSRGKYILFFEPDDFYEDNYVLEDFHLLMNKFNLDTLKMIFRMINSYNYLGYSRIPFHVHGNSKIIYGAQNIDKVNSYIFNEWGNIWNRIFRKNLFIKSLNLLNDRVLNLYQNRRDDYFVNKMIKK